MKPPIENPGFRHVILKKLKDKAHGLININLLKDVGVIPIIGGYETVDKRGNPNLHAHFLCYTIYDKRYIYDNNPLPEKDLGHTIQIASSGNGTLIPVGDLPKLLNYLFKEGDIYPFNHEQTYYSVSQESLDKMQAAAAHQYESSKKTRGMSATQKLLHHFRENKVDIFFQKETFDAKHKAIVRELLKYSRTHEKLIDDGIIFKQSCTILNEFESSSLERRIWANCSARLNKY